MQVLGLAHCTGVDTDAQDERIDQSVHPAHPCQPTFCLSNDNAKKDSSRDAILIEEQLKELLSSQEADPIERTVSMTNADKFGLRTATEQEECILPPPEFSFDPHWFAVNLWSREAAQQSPHD